MKAFTYSGLPVVQAETVDSLIEEYASKPGKHSKTAWGAFLIETHYRMHRENPELARFLDKIVGQQPPEIHPACTEVLMGMYAILERESVGTGNKN